MQWIDVAERLKAAVAVGLAMGGAGCGPAIDPDGGETGAMSGTGTSSGTTTGSFPATTAIPTSTSGEPTGVSTTAQGDGPRFDVGGGFDIGAIPDVGEFQVPCAPVDGAPECEGIGAEVLHPICVDRIGDTTCDQVPEADFFDAAWSCLDCSATPVRLTCERFTLDDATCCSWMVLQPGPSCPGRPFVVDGRPRVPEVIRRDDWSRPCSPSVDALSDSTRSVLARAWAAEGCHEAASVASFSRFVLQLISLGAPSSLIVRAQSAMADEVEHARTFFGLAHAYGGVQQGPDVLCVEGSLDGASDPIACAVSLATEGCIAETISAMQLGFAAARATDPEVAALLSEIAEQELRHAELAWSALAWMLQRGDASVRAAVANAFARAQDAVPRAVSISDGLDPQVLVAVGRLTAAQRLDAAQRALERCVAPAAASALQPWTVTAEFIRPCWAPRSRG